MLISWYVCLFILYSFLGWIYETLFCIITSRRWSNRGFLYGPICPIYGAGVVLLTLLVRFAHHRGMILSAVSIFMVSVIGSALLEYATSYVLEEVFHATWWDIVIFHSISMEGLVYLLVLALESGEFSFIIS